MMENGPVPSLGMFGLGPFNSSVHLLTPGVYDRARLEFRSVNHFTGSVQPVYNQT